MSIKLNAMKQIFKNVEGTADPENFFTDRGTQEEKLFRVLTTEEVFRACESEILGNLAFLDPKYISGFCQCPNIIPALEEISDPYVKGEIPKFNEILISLLDRVEGDKEKFVASMIKIHGAGYFLGAFSEKPIPLPYGLQAFKIN